MIIWAGYDFCGAFLQFLALALANGVSLFPISTSSTGFIFLSTLFLFFLETTAYLFMLKEGVEARGTAAAQQWHTNYYNVFLGGKKVLQGTVSWWQLGFW